MSKKFLIIGLLIWSFIATSVSLYLWHMNKVLISTVITSRDLAKNSNEAYRTIGECVADYSMCDPQEVKAKIFSLDEENDKIWSQLQKYDEQLRPLLSVYDLKKQ